MSVSGADRSHPASQGMALKVHVTSPWPQDSGCSPAAPALPQGRRGPACSHRGLLPRLALGGRASSLLSTGQDHPPPLLTAGVGG